MITTEPILLLGTLSIGEVKSGYQLRVEDTNIIFDNGARVIESELILDAN